MAGKRAGPETRPSLLLSIRDPANDEAWALFVDTYGPLLYRQARRDGLDRHAAEDVMQQVLVRVARAIRSFEYDPARGRFRDWLGTITAHEISRYRSSQGRQPGAVGGSGFQKLLESVDGPDGLAEWDEEFSARICQVAMERIRSEFNPDQWAAFEGTWIEDRRPQEVADELGRQVGWVYKAKCLVLKRLKEEVRYLAEDSVLALR